MHPVAEPTTVCRVQQIVDYLTDYLDEASPGGMLGLYVTGSAIMSGLCPDSDIDFVLVTERSLRPAERRALLDLLLATSGHLDAPVRPLEFTSVVVGDVVPWTYPPACDFQYGEWLRDVCEHGSMPQRHVSPDLAVMITTLLKGSRTVRGAPAGDLLTPVPAADLRRAILDSLPSLLDDLVGDERNVILTLARMQVTIATGDIVSKDEAARRIAPELSEPDRFVVGRAAAAYLGRIKDDWSGDGQQARHTADQLATSIRRAAAELH